jgi:shikimate dehydrogenase
MKVYGLIGKTLGHSFSKKYFTEKFQQLQLTDCVYENFEFSEAAAIGELKNSPEISGLNVTIPYKTSVFTFLDEVTDACRQMNACNCIQVKNDRWMGHNTDVTGFERSFTPHLKAYHHKALILGTGGSSKAVAFVLNKLSIPFLMVSRQKTADGLIAYETLTKDIVEEYTIVINTTPAGMFPGINECPLFPYEYITGKHYFFDLIYNPTKTQFLANAESRGATIENGEQMLMIQAEESWKIWNLK